MLPDTWYPCTLRGVRWLQVVADGRQAQKIRAAQQESLPPAADACATKVSDQAQGWPRNVVQLALFAPNLSETQGHERSTSH